MFYAFIIRDRYKNVVKQSSSSNTTMRKQNSRNKVYNKVVEALFVKYADSFQYEVLFESE